MAARTIAPVAGLAYRRRQAKPRLQVVANDDPFGQVHAELRDAFLAAAKLRLQLAAAERRIQAARMAYAEAHGLQALPRVELLQTRFAPQPGGEA